MGTPKPLLPVGETTLIEWQVARLGSAFRETLIAVADPVQLPSGLRALAVQDEGGAGGPLAGLAAGLARATSDLVFALACDMPRAGVEHAQALLAAVGEHDAAAPRSDRGPDPLCAVYRRDRALSALRAALAEAEQRAAGLLERLDVAYLDAAGFGDALINLNSPADYRAFLGSL